MALPAVLPSGDVVVHDVLADEANRYEPHDKVCAGGVEQARDVDLWLTIDRCGVAVDRLPGRAASPPPRASTRLFTLLPGQVGRYRANFRFRSTECACNPQLVPRGLGHARQHSVTRSHDRCPPCCRGGDTEVISARNW